MKKYLVFTMSLFILICSCATAPSVKKIENTDVPLQKEEKNILKRAQKQIDDHFVPVSIEKIDREGRLETDPEFKKSTEALDGIDAILHWAICAKLGTTTLHNKCRTQSISSIMKWVQTYKPTGNPINENRLIRLFVAIDLLWADIHAKDQIAIQAWLKELIIQGDLLFAAKKRPTVNNWKTWNLAIRSLASKILRDEKLIAETKSLISKQIQDNLIQPAGWQPDPTCENSLNEKTYGSYDFRHRGALHYHVYNLEAWVWIVAFAPGYVNAADLNTIESAFHFLKPYYAEEKKHIEFVCSKIKLDTERKNAGQAEFQAKAWDPQKARRLLRMALPYFSSLKDWKPSFVDEQYIPWLKYFAAQSMQIK